MRLLLILSLLFSNGYNHYQLATDETLDAYFDLVEANEKAMGSVAIIRQGELMYSRSFGHRAVSMGDTIPADSKTVYRIGSISKTYTATLIMKLVEQGKIKLSTTLAEFFPEFKNAKSITLEMMLNHTSGLHNFTDDQDYLSVMYKSISKEELLKHMQKKGVDFEPGQQFSYSNTNYVLLGYIIEKLESQTYNQVLHKYIVDPMKFTSTRFGETINTFSNEAQSYFPVNGKWFTAPETNMSIPHGAGAVVSTALEVCAFADGLHHSKLVSEKSLRDMLPNSSNYGLGISKYSYRDELIYAHSGGIDGFHSQYLYFPEHDITIALCLNALNYSKSDLINKLLDLLFEHNLELPSFNELKLTKEQQDKCVGEYKCDELGLEIKIWRQGDALLARATGQNSFELSALSPSSFRFDAAGLRMDFSIEENNVFNQFMLHQGGDYLFKRTK